MPNRTPRNRWETLVSISSDGPTLTAAARATALPVYGLYQLDPGYFDFIGKALLIKATGRISNVITTPGTARFDVNFLDSAAVNAIVFDGQAVPLEDGEARTTVGWELEILMTCRALGATASLFQFGKFTSVAVEKVFNAFGALPVPALPAILPWNTTPAVGATFDSSKSQVVDLRFTQTVATGSLTVHQYELIAVN